MLRKIQQFFNNSLSLTDADEDQQKQRVDLAAAALLIELSRADFSISEAEQHTIELALGKTLGIKQEQLSELIELAKLENKNATSLYEFTNLINETYSSAEKFSLLKALWQVALADNNICKHEDHLIRKIADLIYVPHSEFIRSKLAVMQVSS